MSTFVHSSPERAHDILPKRRMPCHAEGPRCAGTGTYRCTRGVQPRSVFAHLVVPSRKVRSDLVEARLHRLPGVPTSVRGLATPDTLSPAGICRRPGPHLRWDWNTSAPGPVSSHRCYTTTANMTECAGLNWGALREVGEPASPSPSQPWPAAATPSIRVPFR